MAEKIVKLKEIEKHSKEIEKNSKDAIERYNIMIY